MSFVAEYVFPDEASYLKFTESLSMRMPSNYVEMDDESRTVRFKVTPPNQVRFFAADLNAGGASR